MKTRFLAALVSCLALSSCERAKKLFHQAVKEGLSAGESAGEKPVPLDPELAKLVDRTEEGVLFRRDLPFPGEIRVTVTEKEPMAVRLFQQSEVGKRVTKISSVRHQVMEIRKSPGSIQFSNYKEEFFDDKLPANDAVPAAIKEHPLLPPVPPVDHTMLFRNDVWSRMDNTGFAQAALAQQLGPQMPALLQEYGMSPRPMWFGKRRIAVGRPMEISGELLPMLVAGNATGSLTITLEDIESVQGHPCGRFAIHGSYERKGFPFPDGRLFDEETSIQSGHIWMSVLHPLVLQYRLDRIVTLSVAEGSGPAMRFQGNTSPMRRIEWNTAN